MIELHSWPTHNGHKVSIMLEECGLDYEAIPVNIGAGDQFKPEFLAISPNNKIPAIVDRDGPGGEPISLFESGAILIYLAEKTGRFLPADPRGRYDTLQWLMFQMGGVGPMLGQAHHFRQYAPETIQYGIDRYTNEARRLYAVVDRRLADGDYVAGDYSIADMALYPWMVLHERQGVDIGELPNVRRWLDTLKERPALRRGFDVLKDHARKGPMDEEAKRYLFGQEQYRAR